MRKKTAIVILNYNNYEDTINCVESVMQVNTAPVKYIIIDNGSTREGVVESLTKYFIKKFDKSFCKINEYDDISSLPLITFLVSKSNDGYACGNNKGLKLAYNDEEIDNVLILNNDILFVDDIIPKLIEESEGDNNIGIVSPILFKKNMAGIDYECARKNESSSRVFGRFLLFYINLFGIKQKWDYQQKLLLETPELQEYDRFEVDLPSGACMLINKQLLEEIGGFDPNTFLYYEENILFQKLHSMGKKNYIFPKLKCIHLGASSTKHEVSYFIIKSCAESASYYVKKYTNANLILKMSFDVYVHYFFLPFVKTQKTVMRMLIKSKR